MKILLLVSGGREHALAWKIAQSEKCEKLFVAPGNAGTGSIPLQNGSFSENIPMKADDFEAVKAFCTEKGIDMVVVGPEDPLVKGIYDDLKADSLDAVPLEAVNSERSESYPSFSSNGRWLMVASRRDDGNYTRPYIAHFDPATQTFSKPFELPQQHPSFYTFCLRSFNRPEFMTEPVTVSQKQFVSVVKSEAQKVKFIPMKP